MQVMTELLLGKADPGLREPEISFDISKTTESARLIESLGFDGIMATETKDDPFLPLTLAAQATTRVQLSTNVAIAFPRAPASMALTAWGLQKLARGRFSLGLGSQVKAHLVRRYGLKSAPLAPWMRDYVGAVRAVWNCWQNGTKLNYESEHYKLDLMVPLFNPGPIEWPEIPIHIAAVNQFMCQTAGEVADGIRPHPICTPKYIREVMKPAAAAGAAKSGRDASKLKWAMRPMLATAETPERLAPRVRDIRARVAFYASTPAYRPAFDIFGLQDLTRKLSVLAREQRWEEMPGYISDEVMNTFAVVGTHDEIADKLVERYAGVLDQVGFSIAVENEKDAEKLERMIQRIQAG